jgi:hypothetical protein
MRPPLDCAQRAEYEEALAERLAELLAAHHRHVTAQQFTRVANALERLEASAPQEPTK